MGDADQKKKILIIGGLSAIGKEVAAKLVKNGHYVEFTGTDKNGLNALSEKLLDLAQIAKMDNDSPWRVTHFLNMSNLKSLDVYFNKLKEVAENIKVRFDVVIVAWVKPDTNPPEKSFPEFHRFFTDGVLAPYLLIRKLLDDRKYIDPNIDRSRTEMRFVFLISDPADEKDITPDAEKGFDKCFSTNSIPFIGDSAMRKKSDLGLAIIAEHIRRHEKNVKVVVVNKNDWDNTETVNKESDDLCEQICDFGKFGSNNFDLGTSLHGNRREEFFNYIQGMITKKIKHFSLNVDCGDV